MSKYEEVLNHIKWTLGMSKETAELLEDYADLLAGQTHTDHPLRHYDRTCPACNFVAPTLAELSEKAGDSLMANARFMDELLNAYLSGKLREIGDGEVVVPRKTLAHWRTLVDDNPKDLAPRMDAYLAAKDAK